MDPGHAHKKQICMNIFDAFDRCSADRNNGMLIQATADQNHLDGRMIHKPQGDARAVRNHRDAQVWREKRNQLRCCRAAVNDHHLP